METELREVLKEWIGHLEDLVKVPWMDADERRRIEKQIKWVRENHMAVREESEFEVWRRVVRHISEGKPVDMVDIHMINLHMERRHREGSGVNRVDPAAPAVPRREE